jgi:hypothetical protein
VYYFFCFVIFQLLSSGDFQNIFSSLYDRKRIFPVSPHDTCKSSSLECIPCVILMQAQLRTLRSNETIPSSPRDFRSEYKGLIHRSSNKRSLVLPQYIKLIRNYALVWETSLSFYGAPLAVAISYWLMSILLILSYIFCIPLPTLTRFIDGKQAWGGFSKKALRNWGPMINFATSGVVMTCSSACPRNH